MPATTAAPDISAFISNIPCAGLTQYPPESKVTPLPTNAIFLLVSFFNLDLYSIMMNLGFALLPFPTASNPPIFLFLISFSSNTVTFKPDLSNFSLILSASSNGLNDEAGSF